jgi:hypothetical protein
VRFAGPAPYEGNKVARSRTPAVRHADWAQARLTLPTSSRRGVLGVIVCYDPHRSQRVAGRPERLLIPRRRKYLPPPWVLFEALVEERDQWLRVNPVETWPGVSPAMRPDWVAFSP